MKKQSVAEHFPIDKLSNYHQDAVKDVVANVHVYGDVRSFGHSIDRIFRERVIHQQVSIAGKNWERKIEHLRGLCTPCELVDTIERSEHA